MMTKQKQTRDASGMRSFALVFLVSFGILTLVAAWLLYGQIAQAVTRPGECTVLSSQIHVTTASGLADDDASAAYYVAFKLLLHTADGQQLQVPGVYNSTNFSYPDLKSSKALAQRYPVGSTRACGYTFLDPAGTEAIFAPQVPVEGLIFTAFFFLAGLVVSLLCIKGVRSRSTEPEYESPAPAVVATSGAE